MMRRRPHTHRAKMSMASNAKGMPRAFIVVQVVLVILALVPIIAGVDLNSRTVKTKYGDLKGVIVKLERNLGGVEVFRGVPYASPPVGSLRFMPPVNGAPWHGVKVADKFGPVCPQKLPELTNAMPVGRMEYLRRLLPLLRNQSEDCLYLNIYAPAQGNEQMNALHGGYLYLRSSITTVHKSFESLHALNLLSLRRYGKMFRELILVAAVVLTYVAAADVELYSDKYDYIDVKGILENDRLREQYYDCFMDTAPCVTPDAKFFKANFPESIVTKCERCTEKQKAMFAELIEWYTVNQLEKWEALVAKLIEDAKAMKNAGAM